LTIDAVASRSAEASARASRVRSLIEPFPFQSALKFILQRRGVAIEDAVRAPLRTLDDMQRNAVRALLDDPNGEIAGLLAS
jgi:dihydrodipicolinate synthase/N-acetylneuraminate lyase